VVAAQSVVGVAGAMSASETGEMAAAGCGGGVAGRPATEEEKNILRGARLARAASPEEVEAFMAASASHMSDKAKTAFYGMSAEQQYRVMYEGPLTDCHDSTEILYARVQRFMDMENQLKRLANADMSTKDKSNKERKVSDLALAVGRALVADVPIREVPENERRFAAPAAPAGNGTPAAVGAVPAVKKLVGKIKGVGGVIEALAKKYSMVKGERVRVAAETKELWKFADDRNVPKTHCNQGWRWVLDNAEATPKPKFHNVEPETGSSVQHAQKNGVSAKEALGTTSKGERKRPDDTASSGGPRSDSAGARSKSPRKRKGEFVRRRRRSSSSQSSVGSTRRAQEASSKSTLVRRKQERCRGRAFRSSRSRSRERITKKRRVQHRGKSSSSSSGGVSRRRVVRNCRN